MFRAYDPATDRPVAVKLFTIDLAPELVHQFVADLDRLVAAELTHPAIARPIATGILGNSPYLVEEFIEAESLDIALRVHGTAPVPDALRIGAQIAGALDFAAVSHVHHGALHPRDVLVANQDVRITGLGVARALEQVGISAPTRRPYAAPERVAGNVWHRFADIFSLAALMYEMMWGRRLNGTGLQAVATLEPLHGSDLTSLSIAFSRALAEDPGGRYSRALKFVEALKNAFAGDADTATIKMSHAFPPSDVATVPLPVAAVDVVAQPPAPEPEPELQYELEPDLALQAAEEPVIDIAIDAAAAEEPGIAEPAADEPVFVAPAGPEAIFVEPVVAAAIVAEPVEPAPPAAEPEPVAETVVAAPAVAPPAVDAAAEQPRATTLPFELGPRRRDRARYAPPPDEVELHPEHASVDEPEAGGFDFDAAPPTLLERSRSAIWPLGLALGIGVAIGVGAVTTVLGGRFWTSTDAPTVSPASATTGSAPPVASSSGTTPQAREYTDSAVPEAPKPSTATATSGAPPVAPAPAKPAAPVDREPTAHNVAAPRGLGRILVRSTPAGAHVSVDGHDYGVTPLAVRDLAFGIHAVRVTREGFAPQESRVRVTRSRASHSMVVTLERPRATAAASFTGGLSVDSRPPGAKVYVDGHLIGTTPVQAHTLPAGEHAIRLERDGYRRWTTAVRVVSNEQNRVTASLER